MFVFAPTHALNTNMRAEGGKFNHPVGNVDGSIIHYAYDNVQDTDGNGNLLDSVSILLSGRVENGVLMEGAARS